MNGEDEHRLLPAQVSAPLHRETTAQFLADRLITSIAVGTYPPGQKLPAERELAAALGVSRSTVRDALTRVVEAGLIEVRRGRSGGAFVLGSWGEVSASSVANVVGRRWQELQELMDLRHLVEATITRTAAERCTDADVADLRDALAQYEAASGDLRAAQVADLRLHRTVAAATHNPKLVDLHEQLLAEASLGFTLEPFTTSIYERALPDHREIVRAVIDADVDAAWAIGRHHFAITTDEVRAVLERAVQHTRHPA